MATAAKERNEAKGLVKELSKENSPESPIVQDLRTQVANAVVLYLNYKHYHWQTYGPHFRDLHKLFDEWADEVHETLDPLAERVRMIGQSPPAHPLEAADLATVTAAAPHATMREMLEKADRNALVVIKEMRDAAARADEHSDPGTSTCSRDSCRSTRSTSGGPAICCRRATACRPERVVRTGAALTPDPSPLGMAGWPGLGYIPRDRLLRGADPPSVPLWNDGEVTCRTTLGRPSPRLRKSPGATSSKA